MRRQILSTDEISKIIGLSSSTTRVYLSNYRFADYRSKLKFDKHTKDVYTFCRPFVYQLCDMLISKKQFKALDNLEKYCEEDEENDKRSSQYREN